MYLIVYKHERDRLADDRIFSSYESALTAIDREESHVIEPRLFEVVR